MKEQRRHQRIRFNSPPPVRLGQAGFAGTGVLENLSLGGMMVCTSLPLKVGEAFGCEFGIDELPLIDLFAEVVSRIGDCYGARFRAGPVSHCLLQNVIDASLTSGEPRF